MMPQLSPISSRTGHTGPLRRQPFREDSATAPVPRVTGPAQPTCAAALPAGSRRRQPPLRPRPGAEARPGGPGRHTARSPLCRVGAAAIHRSAQQRNGPPGSQLCSPGTRRIAAGPGPALPTPFVLGARGAGTRGAGAGGTAARPEGGRAPGDNGGRASRAEAFLPGPCAAGRGAEAAAVGQSVTHYLTHSPAAAAAAAATGPRSAPPRAVRAPAPRCVRGVSAPPAGPRPQGRAALPPPPPGGARASLPPPAEGPAPPQPREADRTQESPNAVTLLTPRYSTNHRRHPPLPAQRARGELFSGAPGWCPLPSRKALGQHRPPRLPARLRAGREAQPAALPLLSCCPENLHEGVASSSSFQPL